MGPQSKSVHYESNNRKKVWEPFEKSKFWRRSSFD